jgi:hypothetical protein
VNSTDAALEQLQTIRLLMEIMTLAGIAGVAAATVGYLARPHSSEAFIALWSVTGMAVLVGAFAMVRRQALRERESFFSPPTRRVLAAMLPPFLAGGVATLPLGFLHGSGHLVATVLPPVWMVFYGCGLHAAGFFMLRGIRWLGWAFLLTGLGLGLLPLTYRGWEPTVAQGHIVMGAVFGGGHLAYAAWLAITKRRSAS